MAAETTKKPCPNQNEENISHHLSQTTKKSNEKRNETSNIKSQKHTRKNTRKITKMKKTAAMKQIASKPTKHPTNQPQHELYTRLHVESKTIQKGNQNECTNDHPKPPGRTYQRNIKNENKQNQTSPKASHKQETTMINEPSYSNGSYQPTPRKIPIPSAKWHGRRNAAIGQQTSSTPAPASVVSGGGAI